MKTTVCLMFTLLIIACGRTEKPPVGDASAIAEEPVIPDYKEMAPYAEGTDELVDSELETLQIVDDPLLTTQASWQFFDSKFSATASPGLQQYIGYVVLNQKDVIDLAAKNPTNATYQAILKKYVNAFTTTKYIGYCTLYHALKHVDDPLYRKTKAAEILVYAKEDTFLDDANSNGSAPSDILAGVHVNYSYIDSLTVMAQ
jgi:hypothetical protein